MDSQTINTYNKLAKEYDEETKDFWDRFPRTIVDKFIELTSQHGHVLDVGSGPGRDALMLKEAGFDVVCIDASKEMVRMSRARGLKTTLGDFCALPFADNEFDGVWSYTSLLHIPKKEVNKAFAEIARVLKTGGVFGLGLIEGTKELYRESSGVGLPRWFSFYKRKEVEDLLTRHGFDILYFEEFRPKTKNYLNFIAKKV
jgi:ubiquinone/menaquinone biosynthesis C-methylase UbiE